MTTNSSMLHVRMDSGLKREAIQALEAMGLTASEAVRLLFHRIAVDQAFPLELKVPNAETRGAMAEVDELVNSRNARFANADEMFAEPEKAAHQSANRPAAPGRLRTELPHGLGTALALRAIRHEAAEGSHAATHRERRPARPRTEGPPVEGRLGGVSRMPRWRRFPPHLSRRRHGWSERYGVLHTGRNPCRPFQVTGVDGVRSGQPTAAEGDRIPRRRCAGPDRGSIWTTAKRASLGESTLVRFF